MRLPFPERVERGRIQHRDLGWTSSPGDDFGAFELLHPVSREWLRVIASSGTDEIPWEHVSVSTRSRCPTWDEMCWVKALFFDDDEPVMQLHPPKSTYVNHHPFCLHLWRPTAAVLPLPPTIAVGPMGPTRRPA